MRKVLVVVHQASSDPGLVGQVLRSNGYSLEICCVAEGDRLPASLESYSGVVVFGGPMSANDDDTLPFIRAELDWIPLVLEAKKPYLGICLGAQLLARVLGAKVVPHPEGIREIGYAAIQPTLHSHNPFAPLTHVYHWHKEGFDLPTDAVLLATGEVFPQQAFRYGDHAYGTQFHPEITSELIRQWTERGADQLVLPGAQPYDVQVQRHDRHAATVESWLKSFLPYWLKSEARSTNRLTA